MLTLLTLAFSTLISEDVACVTAGVLIASGDLHPLAGVAACAAGIFLGDLGLWGIGRFGGDLVSSWPMLHKQLDRARAQSVSDWVRSHAGGAIVASRFLPGTRRPIYLTAGAARIPLLTFAAWSGLAAAVWTPVVVLMAGTLSARAGEAASVGVAGFHLTGVVAGLSTIPLIAIARAVVVPSVRRDALSRLARWRHWEFWPMWLFYAPVAVWIGWLALRYRGLTTLTAANPGIPDGGTVGESKFAILDTLPADTAIASFRLAEGDASLRFLELQKRSQDSGWVLPLVLKPDVGQRGVGVRLIKHWDDARQYLADVRVAVLVQPYNPGPFEAGVFYYRLPQWPRGRILSITDKVFPEVVGDGQSTVEMLVQQHARFRLQADLFLTRHACNRRVVPRAGESYRLALAGNHAQGTMFRDGAHLLTPALESRIDDIAQQVPGFFIGRFDIRYGSVERFMQGKDLAIVELNGATAESTNIYDPSASLLFAYRTLCLQWSLVFAIGDANRRLGASPTPWPRLFSLVRAHLTTVPLPMSD